MNSKSWNSILEESSTGQMRRSYEAIGAYVHGLHRSMLNISASKPILITSTRINLPTASMGQTRWIKDGDANALYFHKVAFWHEKMVRIINISRGQNAVVGQANTFTIFTEHFKALLIIIVVKII